MSTSKQDKLPKSNSQFDPECCMQRIGEAITAVNYAMVCISRLSYGPWPSYPDRLNKVRCSLHGIKSDIWKSTVELPDQVKDGMTESQ